MDSIQRRRTGSKSGGGGLRPLTVYYDNRGVWGHARPENFGNFDSLRVSDAFWQQFLD